MATVKTSGSQTATVTTEHTLATVTDAGTFLVCVDLADMSAGDVVSVKVYGKARSTDTERLLHSGTYGPGIAATPLVQSIPIVSPHHLKVTLTQSAGVSADFPWAVYEV